MAALIVAPSTLVVELLRAAAHEPYFAFTVAATASGVGLGIAALAVLLSIRRDDP